MTLNGSWTSSISKPILGLILFCLFSGTTAQAQDSTAIVEGIIDTATVDTGHSPKKAVLLSSFLPGAGQIYNNSQRRRTWWKVPIIYAGLGSTGYFIGSNHRQFIGFRDAYKARLEDPNIHDGSGTVYENYTSADALLNASEVYRRNRDLSVLGFTVVYVLQVIDASVDAHLFYFDVSNDLSLQWSPMVRPSYNYASRPMAGLTLSIKL